MLLLPLLVCFIDTTQRLRAADGAKPPCGHSSQVRLAQDPNASFVTKFYSSFLGSDHPKSHSHSSTPWQTSMADLDA